MIVHWIEMAGVVSAATTAVAALVKTVTAAVVKLTAVFGSDKHAGRARELILPAHQTGHPTAPADVGQPQRDTISSLINLADHPVLDKPMQDA